MKRKDFIKRFIRKALKMIIRNILKDFLQDAMKKPFEYLQEIFTDYIYSILAKALIEYENLINFIINLNIF